VDVSYAGLKFAMAIPQQDKLKLVDTLSNEEIKKDILDLSNDFKYENRSEVQTLNTSNKLLGYQVRRYQLGAIPTIAAGWNVGKSAQRSSFDVLDFDGKWYLTNYVGLSVNVPIFDGNQRRNKVKQAQYSLEKNRNSLKQFEQLVDFQIVATRTQLVNAISALSTQEDNKQLAERVYNTTKTKYEKGLGSSFEVLQSETSLSISMGGRGLGVGG